jgi:hypothetical protein
MGFGLSLLNFHKRKTDRLKPALLPASLENLSCHIPHRIDLRRVLRLPR